MHPPLAQLARTLCSHCAMSQAWPGHVAAHAGRVVRHVNEPPARAVACHVAASPTMSHAQPAVSWPCPQPYRNLSRDTTQRPSRSPVTIRPTVSRHNSPTARPSCARRSPLHAGRPCRRASRPCHRPSPRPYRGPVRPCRGRDWPCRGLCNCAQLPCVTIQSIVS